LIETRANLGEMDSPTAEECQNPPDDIRSPSLNIMRIIGELAVVGPGARSRGRCGGAGHEATM
jgi:hypothetical protein